MKLRNKKTGQIYNACHIAFGESIEGLERKQWKTLEEFNEDWEDVEEPKGMQGLTTQGEDIVIRMSSIEEAEQAVEKLKAWKRLKDKGFKFECWWGGSKLMAFSIPQEIIDKTTAKDLDLLFGGEE